MNRADIERMADELYTHWQDEKTFLSKAEEADIPVLTALIAKLGSTGSAGARHDALRGGCNAILQRKLNEKLIDTMVKLDNSANFLAWVGIALSLVIGVAQIVLPFFCKAR